MAMPINTPTPGVEMRITRLFGLTVRLDTLLRKVGLSLPLKVVAWAAGRSVQAKLCGKWVTIKIDPNEVLSDAAIR